MVPIVIVGGFLLAWLPIYIMSPSFGKPNVKNIIQIYSDNDFDEYDFIGTGASDNPYIIENRVLGINASGVKRFYYGLDVANTTKYFIVQNCTFFGGLNAIRLEDVSEGTVLIRDSWFFARVQREWDHEIGRSGIEIRNTSKVTIRNNTFAPAYKYTESFVALTVYKSNKIIFENNTNNAGFFDISKSLDILLIGNQINNILDIQDSHHLNFTNNFFGGEIGFIEFINCSYSFFKGNIFNLTTTLWNSPYCVFSHNKINDSSGLHLKESSFVEVYNNTIIYTGEEIESYHRGIILYRESCYCTIQANRIYNFPYYGVYIIDDSNFNTIYHNSFYNNFIIDSSSQAYDECSENIWYNSTISEGNYWSNLGMNIIYEIDGSAGSVDLYPLPNPFT